MVIAVLKRFTDELQVTRYAKIWGVEHPNLNFWGVRTPTTPTVALISPANSQEILVTLRTGVRRPGEIRASGSLEFRQISPKMRTRIR